MKWILSLKDTSYQNHPKRDKSPKLSNVYLKIWICSYKLLTKKISGPDASLRNHTIYRKIMSVLPEVFQTIEEKGNNTPQVILWGWKVNVLVV